MSKVQREKKPPEKPDFKRRLQKLEKRNLVKLVSIINNITKSLRAKALVRLSDRRNEKREEEKEREKE